MINFGIYAIRFNEKTLRYVVTEELAGITEEFDTIVGVMDYIQDNISGN